MKSEWVDKGFRCNTGQFEIEASPETLDSPARTVIRHISPKPATSYDRDGLERLIDTLKEALFLTDGGGLRDLE